MPPLLVVEFLHRIMDIFADYFSECTEQRIKEHYVTVYEVSSTTFMPAVVAEETTESWGGEI